MLGRNGDTGHSEALGQVGPAGGLDTAEPRDPPGGVDLVFTSPEAPDLNAAYPELHSSTPTERQFLFADAATTEYQAVYSRNNRLAFRPSEQSGVEFTRTLLVSPRCQMQIPGLRAVKPLRDLMTAALPYIIVRDALGHRWYGSLTVPSATVVRVVPSVP